MQWDVAQWHALQKARIWKEKKEEKECKMETGGILI